MRLTIRSGFTVVELLIVITIIGILLSLLMPAVQAARESGRKSMCANNLKQVGLAMHTYHDSHRSLPVGAYSCCWGTWMVAVMPFMELQGASVQYSYRNMYHRPTPGDTYASDVNRPITTQRFNVFTCPSDLTSTHRNGITHHNYVVNMGNTGIELPYNGGRPIKDYQGIVFWGAPFSAEGTGGANPTEIYPSVSFPLSEITDGLSNTLMLSETIQGQPAEASPMDYRGFAWWGSGCHFETYLTPNSSEPDVTEVGAYCNAEENPGFPCIGATADRPQTIAARSRHPGGVHACLCDASVRFVIQTIDRSVWNPLGTTRGGETVSEF